MFPQTVALPITLQSFAMDTPAIPAPKDASERAILEKLQSIRDQLLLLKLDRTKYIRSQYVMVLYDQVIEQVRLLNETRQGRKHEENRCQTEPAILPPCCFGSPVLWQILTRPQWTRCSKAASS